MLLAWYDIPVLKGLFLSWLSKVPHFVVLFPGEQAAAFLLF